jgi:hypothetical protein
MSRQPTTDPSNATTTDLDTTSSAVASASGTPLADEPPGASGASGAKAADVADADERSEHPPDPSVWERSPRESGRAHRAFLLWAMQDDDRRSVRAAGRAVGRAEATAREWRKRWGWNDRIKRAGELASIQSATVYRARYYPEHKLREVVEIEERMAAPFTPDAPIPSSVADQVREAVKPTPTDQAKRDRQARTRRAHVSLVDGALGLIAKRITAGDVRVSLRDIPHLLQLRGLLTTADTINGANGSGALPPLESTRVRHARASGGCVVSAMHDDARELVAILGAIVSADTVPRVAVAELA